MRRFLPVALGCVFLALPALAQRGGGGHGGGGGHVGGGGGIRSGGSAGFRSGSAGFRGGSAAFRGSAGFRGGLSYRGGFRGRYGYRGFYGYYGWPYYYPGLYSGYYDPSFWDSGYGDPYYNGYSYDTGDAGYGYAPPPPPPPEPPAPALREYPAPTQQSRPPQARKYEETLYLLAMTDGTIRAVLAYWVDGKALRYVTMDNEQKQAPLSSIDRNLSERLNRERNVTFRLPG